MNEQTKQEANHHQIEQYFQSYDRFWRLNKLLLIKKNLEEREDVISNLESFYGEKYFEYESYVYNNITNGLLADAVSEIVMLCEDYFGILKFIRDDHYFIKRILNYKAGAVTALSKKLNNISHAKLRKLFFIPNEAFIEINFSRANLATAKSEIDSFNLNLDNLLKTHNSAIQFYETHAHAYISYKHGLKLGLNGISQGSLTKDAIKKQKETLSTSVFKFENKNKNLSSMIIPNIANKAIKNNIKELLEDMNLLHFSLLHELHIDDLIEVAKNILCAISVLVANRTSLKSYKQSNKFTVILPSSNDLRLTSISCDFYEYPRHPIPKLKDFKIKL